ncbi:cell division protein SepF [Romeria aff. gracilis LEGE 07310]|uniref:Cell division protein SepF n=1 Tax=Vasconcelosia minhoensis LEGE 07310 TaxID=915328 RepID=A0A8J7DMD1_9CYAN|nr:cell division protein SepF [Romeria gracilis]MBE9078531.1 cell division protein SepF [Romeria aff. gracilis LEGE 07310]
MNNTRPSVFSSQNLTAELATDYDYEGYDADEQLPPDYDREPQCSAQSRFQTVPFRQPSNPPAQFVSRARRETLRRPASSDQPVSSSAQTIPSSQSVEVIIMEPDSFQDMTEGIEALRSQKLVVLNLSEMDHSQAQRSIDFIAGGTYSLDGNLERISDGIFLFTPYCVQINNRRSKVASPPPSPAAPPTYEILTDEGQPNVS